MAIASSSDKALLRDITIILIIKLALLYIIWSLFFSTDVVEVTTDSLSNSLLDKAPSGEKQ